jgi:hypothetical protein
VTQQQDRDARVRRILDETLPEDPPAQQSAGHPITERQLEYFLRQIDLLQEQIPSAEDLAFLKMAREEKEHMSWIWAQTKKHFPWVAAVVTIGGSFIVYVLTHHFHVTPKQ